MQEIDPIKALNQSINRFDLSSLLKAIEEKGIDIDKLLYVGTQHQVSTARICDEIAPTKDTVVSAQVKLNLGLLTTSSPLPSYYMKSVDKGEINEESFTQFIQYFNHHVIKTIVKYAWIERLFFEDWDGVKRASLSMLGLDSVSTLHWLFHLYFPELELTVGKNLKEQRINSADFTIGISRLGEKNALGGYVRRKRRGYAVAFRSDTAQTEARIFWPTEIRRRLQERILPLLKKTHIYLVVTFTIDQYHRATYLNQLSYLGFTSLGETTSNFTWKLFEGQA